MKTSGSFALATALAVVVIGCLAGPGCAADRGPVFAVAQPAEPLRLHPANPHYLIYKGRPTVLLTSGEHWGAVLNLDFNYTPYLDTLKASGINFTRVFSGSLSYRPDPAQPDADTQAPQPGRLITPWARVEGAASPDMFDLSRWNDAYFARLKDFLRQAEARGIIVEYVFFRRANERKNYVSPLHSSFNVNGVGKVEWPRMDTITEPALLEAQIAFVKKVVTELAGVPNLYYDISHASNDSLDGLAWQNRMVAAVREVEVDPAARHLIAANHGFDMALMMLNPARSILLGYFPRMDFELGALDLLDRYYSLDRAIGMGKDYGVSTALDLMSVDEVRITGWETMLAGGALYLNKNLDYTTKNPTGDTPATRAARATVKRLKDFVESFNFIKLAPSGNLIKSGVPAGASARLLAEPGKQYAAYIHHGRRGPPEGSRIVPQPGMYSVQLELDLAPGSYRAEWIDPPTLEVRKTEQIEHAGGSRTLASPSYSLDVALRIR